MRKCKDCGIEFDKDELKRRILCDECQSKKVTMEKNINLNKEKTEKIKFIIFVALVLGTLVFSIYSCSGDSDSKKQHSTIDNQKNYAVEHSNLSREEINSILKENGY